MKSTKGRYTIQSAAATITIATIISNVTSVFTAAMGWAADVGEAIAGNPLLLLFCIIPLVGLGVGLFRRLLGVR